MKHAILVLLCSAFAYLLSSCKIVYDDENASDIPPGPEGDLARNTERLNSTFESQLIPLINDKALDILAFRSALDAGIDNAGEQHGNRGSGMGAAWNFAIGDSGEIVEAKLDTSARKLGVDTDADGEADVTVQLGPVIRGTALRDFAPFYNFDEFRDQIEFAKLSRAINERIKPGLVVPDGDLIGRNVLFTGIAPLKKPTDTIVLTPVSIEFAE